MFKPGDKAFFIRMGWGKIFINDSMSKESYPLKWISDDDKKCSQTLTRDGFSHKGDKYQSFFHKEQKFDLSEPEPEIGTWGYFVDSQHIVDDSPGCYLDILRGIKDGKFICSESLKWDTFSPYPSLPQHIKDMMEGKG